jgi:riboflavin-specific deaminase-like protein
MTPACDLICNDWLGQAEQHVRRTGRPLVSLCFAQSLDGSLAAEPGHPTPLSGPDSKALTHQLRAAHDAILVGIGTVLADNPQLTVRYARGENPQPVIVDSHLRTPPVAFLVDGHPKPAWIAAASPLNTSARELLEGSGVQVLEILPGPDGRVDLDHLLKHLAEKGVRSLMVEGGAQIISAFLQRGLVDWLSITLSPRLVGGLRAVERRLPAALALQDVTYQPCGKDLVIWGKFD